MRWRHPADKMRPLLLQTHHLFGSGLIGSLNGRCLFFPLLGNLKILAVITTHIARSDKQIAHPACPHQRRFLAKMQDAG